MLTIFFSFSLSEGPETDFFSVHQTKWMGASQFSYFEMVSGIESLIQTRFKKADPELAKEIVDISLSQRLDPLWVTALIWTESSFNKKAVSYKGARGLMQLMPATAKEVLNQLPNKENTHWHQAKRNIELGSFYLKNLFHKFNGNHKLASMAYNLGRVGLLRKIRKSGVPKMIYWTKIQKRYQYLVFKLQRSKQTAKADSVKII